MIGLRRLAALVRGRRGTVLVLYGLALTLMMGFAAISIDAGNVYLERQRLVDSLDAAALAGVARLPDDSAAAEQAARDILEAGGRDADTAVIGVSGNNLSLTVGLGTYVNLFFTRALGFDRSWVPATAEASVEWVTGVKGAVPFGVPQQDFQLGSDYTLKASGGGGQNGNFYSLALGGNGANNYREKIAEGYQSIIRIGDWLTTETGNMAGPTEQGLEQRIEDAPTADADGDGDDDENDDGYLDLSPNSPRVLICPIIDYSDAHGRSQVQVVGFGAFYVKDWGVSGNGEVRGKFVRFVTEGESGGVGNFGLRTIRLTR